ncbi:MAG TPA: phosphotransferase [Candidatus Saccharimonadales bacterium]|nr:phosphotransferase [Candidatus Saccharimonadales bacterium]
MHDITNADIQHAVNSSGLQGFTGKYSELGGGEVNDTFALDCGNSKAVLRISRFESSWMLQLEADALELMDFNRVPHLLFFDGNKKIKNRLWIIESFVPGQQVDRLNLQQYRSLGQLLAKIHKIVEPELSAINFWDDYLRASKMFGDENKLLHHPDQTLHKLINKAHDFFIAQNQKFEPIHKSLIHGDLTPNNFLVNGDEVSLIDWEFASFKDPMSDFSTIYYPDMELNDGRWRVHITPDERSALFNGYADAGGTINERLIEIDILVDKLCTATYNYWKVHQSGHPIEDDRLAQYQFDYGNLIKSLGSELSKD